MKKDKERIMDLLREALEIQKCSFGTDNPTVEAVAGYLCANGVTAGRRWIPVTERLPEAKVDVLAVMHYMDGRTAVNQGWYSALNEQWYIGVAGIHAPVTHWMPLPDAPKEDTE